MDFEKAYDNYKAGAASDEEKAFVESEIEKARKLNSIIDELDSKKEILVPSDLSDVKRAQKKHVKRSIVRVTVIALIVVVLCAGIICAGVFGQAISSAKSNLKCSEDSAKSNALSFVEKNYHVTDDGAVLVTELERDLVLDGKHSFYKYYVEIQNGAHMKVTVSVDGRNGLTTLEEIDNE